MSAAVPLRLDREQPFPQPLVGLVSINLDEANALLENWEHYLGGCDRPFHNDGWALDVDGEPIAVATSSSIVGDTAAGYPQCEVVELSRLCVRPGEEWATRVMLRLWREQCGRKWPCPDPRMGLPPLAAVAYSKNERHDGRIYRFDGWERVTTHAGSSGGGTWSRKRRHDDAASGAKTLWLWRYQVPEPQGMRSGGRTAEIVVGAVATIETRAR